VGDTTAGFWLAAGHLEDIMQRSARHLVTLCAAVALAAGAASCASSATPQAGTGSGQPGSSTPATQPVTPNTSVSLAGCAGGWRATALAVARQVTVPPVPVATAIRTGSHPDCRFDRIVIDFKGQMPGYTIAFVSKVIQDASGKTISMPGTRYLLIRLRPAQGHSASGATTLPPRSQALSYPMLKGYAVAGDFEGVLSIALGLAGGTHFRASELPGRLYVDVAW
jgi:hypothetical protein